MAESVTLDVDGTAVKVTNPSKVYFPETGYTKLDLVNYYLAVGEAALRGVRDRPMNLKRYVNGVAEDPFFQKRAPAKRPPGVETVTVTFPSDRRADVIVCDTVADIAWCVNLGCVDLNPWPIRKQGVNTPDELRIDLDPTPEATWKDVQEVALMVGEFLEGLGYRSYPKTSGSRGIHIYVRIEPRWGFGHMRRAALAIGREIEKRAPGRATTAWWKEERHGVFIDYNQNARDRTIASAYSVRPTPDARVSCPLEWSEVPKAQLTDFTIETVPKRLKSVGDPAATIDDERFSLQPLLDLVAKHEAEGQGDAPWPPNYPKMPGEPPRVQPSRRKKS
jgi:bifunctional non-homologous end joining protein LigD